MSKEHERENYPESRLGDILYGLISPATECIKWRRSRYPDTYYTYVDNNTISIVKNKEGYYIIVNDMYFYIGPHDKEYFNAQHLFHNKIKSYFVQKNIELDQIIEKIEKGCFN